MADKWRSAYRLEANLSHIEMTNGDCQPYFGWWLGLQSATCNPEMATFYRRL